MAEVINALENLGNGRIRQMVTNTVTVVSGTSTTVVVSPIEAVGFNKFSIQGKNTGGEGGAVTIAIWGSNYDSVGSPTGSAQAVEGWSQIGNNVAIASGANTTVCFGSHTASYSKVAITAGGAASGSSLSSIFHDEQVSSHGRTHT